MKDPKKLKDIDEIRNCIDELDFHILKLFGDRNLCVKEIVNFKTDREGVIAKERQESMLALRRKWAEEYDLDPDLYEKIFKILIDSNIRKQLEIIEQSGSNSIKNK
ncbi:MAG: chorismate mutase [Bacteroidales bacterium]|nr:chorismate mutase [Bacteroidales bacterium]